MVRSNRPPEVNVAANSAPRVCGLEWLRAGMAIGVLAFHAAVSYTRIPLPGLNWCVHEAADSLTVDVVCWGLNGLIMPVFFLLSGFCSARIFARLGATRFVEHRTRRLLPALCFGGVVILPLTAYAWFFSWAAQGLMPFDRLWRWGIPDHLERELYGLGHLWFVQYLWLFCLVVGGISRLMTYASDRCVVRLHRLQESVMSSFWMPFLFAIPAAAMLAIEPRIVIGFRQSIFPPWENLVYYWPCFAAGFWLRRGERRRQILMRWCEWRGLMAGMVFVVLWPALRSHLQNGSTGLNRWIVAGLFSTYAWLAATSLFGLAVKYLDREAPTAVKYLADASFCVYLVHVPIVGLIQTALCFVSLSMLMKFGATTFLGLCLSVGIYAVAVRGTRLGQLLDPSPSRAVTTQVVEVADEIPDVAPLLVG